MTTFHGYLPLEAAANGASKRALFFYENLVKEALNRSDAVITVDTRIMHWLDSDYWHWAHKHPMWCIPNGVDTTMFTPHPPREDGSHVPTVFVPKAPMPKNGIEVAMKAAPLVHQEVDHFILEFGYGKIPHEQMPQALNASDIVLIPSVPVAGVEEATSILALEAMACGKPVVASDIGGLKEIIEDGETGVLVAPGDPGALAQEVIELLQDDFKRDYLGRRAREYVVANHTWAQVARETVKVYEEVLGEM